MKLTPPDSPEPDTQAPVHNLSVLKAVALIGCFIESTEGKTLTELARRTGMNVSTAYRMLRTLVHTGVLHRHQGEERYFPGPMLLALAGATFSGAGYGALVEVLRGLSAETGEAASLAVRDGDCAAVLFATASPQQMRFEHRPGERVLLHCTAMGLALLATESGDLARAVAGLLPLQPITPHSITDPERLVEVLRQT